MRRISGKGQRRVDSLREETLAHELDLAAESNPYTGRPLALHPSPFPLEPSTYLQAVVGAPAWSIRLVRIQEIRAQLEADVTSAWAEHRRRLAGRPGEFARQWQRYISELDFSEINDLIDKHNSYYPIEARLRMHWPSGRYVIPRGIDYPQARVTPESLLARFPDDLSTGDLSK